VLATKLAFPPNIFPDKARDVVCGGWVRLGLCGGGGAGRSCTAAVIIPPTPSVRGRSAVRVVPPGPGRLSRIAVLLHRRGWWNGIDPCSVWWRASGGWGGTSALEPPSWCSYVSH